MSPNRFILRCIQPGEAGTASGNPHLPAGHYLITGLSGSTFPIAIRSAGCDRRTLCLPLYPGRSTYLLRLEDAMPGAVAELLEPSPQAQPRVVLHRLSPAVSMYRRMHQRLAGRVATKVHRVGRLLRCDAAVPDDDYGAWFNELPDLLLLQLEAQTPRIIAQAGPEAVPGDATQDWGLATGIHMHVHYADLWPAMRDRLAMLPASSRVFITTNDASLSEQIRSECAHADVHEIDNRGRDVAPFLHLLGAGAFDGLDAVCKLHSKKSVRGSGESYCGRVWRNRLFDDLLGSHEQVGRILRRFAEEPDLGVLGPAWARLPNQRVDLGTAVGSNRDAMLAMIDTWPQPVALEQLDFFAGTMFWFRPAALAGLTATTADLTFPAEPLQHVDGSPAHCLERLIPTWAKSAGYRIRSI